MQSKEYYKEWNLANKDKVSAKNKKWRDKNKESENKRVSKWQKDNKEKSSEKVKRWNRNNPDKIREASLQSKYGISSEKYNEMYGQQNGLCYICHQPETLKYRGEPRRLSVDHNHETGSVRALLCDACNRGIGNFKDNIELLDNAKKYLENFKKEGGN